MTGYAFVFQGETFTPDGRADVADVDAHNKAIEQAELAHWAGRPDRFAPAYYHFGEGINGTELAIRRPARYFSNDCYVSTWLGARIGRIVAARVYRHNFGSRMVAIRVKGTNGATYYGRASWDNGECIRLRRVGK